MPSVSMEEDPLNAAAMNFAIAMPTLAASAPTITMFLPTKLTRAGRRAADWGPLVPAKRATAANAPRLTHDVRNGVGRRHNASARPNLLQQPLCAEETGKHR